MFITSRGTMDKIDPTLRKHIADRADLVGAIRLPNTAFKRNANTEVTADVVILKKRGSKEAPRGPAWKKVIPYTWLVDPTPLPPHAAIPELNLTDWQQLKTMSQKERDLILIVSGFSENAWGARGVFLGSDLSQADWSAAVDDALKSFETSPSVLQRFERPKTVEAQWFDFAKNEVVPMKGRVRLCPYYFVSGEGDNLRPQLGGVLATIVPADKKIVHGMTDAVLAPCAV